MGLKLKTAPAQEPVTSAEAKLHCKIDASTEDTWVANSIKSARRDGENITGRQFVQATYYLYLDEFPKGDWTNPEAAIYLPKPPLQSVTSVGYTDTSGTSQTLTVTTDYVVVDDSDYMLPKIVPAYGTSWPSTYAMPKSVVVEYITGWPVAAGTATTPENIKEWIMSRVASKYAFRENIYTGINVAEELPHAYADGLLDEWIVKVF